MKGVTLKWDSLFRWGPAARQAASVWADDCTIIGDGRWHTWDVHPLSSQFGRLFLTDSSITDVRQATSGSFLCRGLTITHISDDAFQSVPLVINCTVDDVDPDPLDDEGNVVHTGWHADLWQMWGGNETNKRDWNVIVYGLRGTNLKYQSLFVRPDEYSQPSYAEGMAFVNVYADLPYPVPEDLNDPANLPENRHSGGWFRWVNHLLWWNCSLTTYGIAIGNEDYYYDDGTGPAWHNDVDIKLRNFSCLGSDLAFLTLGGNPDVPYLNGDPTQWEGWEHNHFVWPQEADGFRTRGNPLTMTTGDDMLNDFGVPRYGSPLLRRFDRQETVPVDLDRKQRTPLADVGAYQYEVTWTQKATAPTATKPTARTEHAMAWDNNTGNVVLFGGRAGQVDNAETWEWDEGVWTQRSPSLSPPAQHGHAMACLGDVTLVGESGPQTMTTWEWDGSQWLPRAPIYPTERLYSTLTFDVSGVGFLFGGLSSATPQAPLDQLWAYYGYYTWEDISAEQEPSPPARYAHAMDGVFQAPEGGHAGRPAVMFGGTDGSDVLTDTWLFTGWTWDNELFQPLAGMDSLDSSLASQFAILSPNGGGGEEGGHGWEEVQPLVSPPARYGAAMANRVLFGGNTGLQGTSGLLGDTWFFRDGPNASWLPLTEGGPSPRQGHSMVWDIDRNVIVLFGGQTGDTTFSDETWELDLSE